MEQRPDEPSWRDDEPTGLPADFERLRWFELPRACLPLEEVPGL